MASPKINNGVTLDFGAMGLVELQDEAERLAAVVELAQDQRRAIFAVVAARLAAARARQRIAGLSAIDKEATIKVAME